MRAMVLQRSAGVTTSPLTLQEVTLPIPRPGEVRAQVRCCGVCHTDLHIVEGDLPLPKLPVIPGHQIVGIVDAVGRDVRVIKEGDRVGIPWLYSADGICGYCRHGFENLCDNAQFTGYHVDGGYGEHAVVREDFAHPIPKNFSDENAAPLLCAGVIGYRSYRLSGAHADSLVLQLARHEGCEAYVFTRSQAHRDLAKKLGAVWVGAAEDVPPQPLDASIVFAPAGSLIPHALRALRKGGILVLAGVTMSPIPQMDYSLLYQERQIRTVANSTRQDVREFLELAAEAPVRTEVQVFDLEQANSALQALKKSEIKAAAVLQISRS